MKNPFLDYDEIENKKDLTSINRTQLQTYINNNFKDEADLTSIKSYDAIYSEENDDDLYEVDNEENARDYRIDEYKKMLKNGYVKRAVKIYTSSQINKNLEGRIISLKTSVSKYKEILYNLFFVRLNIEDDLSKIAYQCNSYGEYFMILIPNSYKNPKYIKTYQFIKNPKRVRVLEKEEKIIGYLVDGEKYYFPYEVVHFKYDTGEFDPYGEATIEGAREAWRHYKLLKDFMIIQRMENAEKTAIVYPIGNKNKKEAREYGQLIRNSFRKQSYLDSEGNIKTTINPSSFFERFYIPVKKSGEKIDIIPVKGATPISQQDDVSIALDEMIRAFAILNAYMGVESGGEIANATLAQLDVNFAKSVEEKNNFLIRGLYKMAYVELILQGVIHQSDYNMFEISLTAPSDLAEQRLLQGLSEKFNAVSSLLQFELPKKFIMKKYLGFSEKDLMEIEAYRKEEQAEQMAQEGAGSAGGSFGGGSLGDMGAGFEGGSMEGDMETGGEMEGTEVPETGGAIEGEAGNPAVGGTQPPVAENIGESKQQKNDKLLLKNKVLLEKAKQQKIDKLLLESKTLLEKAKSKKINENFLMGTFFNKGEMLGIKSFKEKGLNESIRNINKIIK